MMFLNNKIYLILLFTFLSTLVVAQDVTFQAKAPSVVSAGERFRLTYSVNAQGSGFQAGDLSGFTVLSGPSSSTQSSVQIINGKMEQSMKVSYSYILEASKEGTFTISPGKVTVDGKEYMSNALRIEVVKSQNTAKSNTNSRNRGNNTPPASSGNDAVVGNEDLYMRMLISKREVIQGEPIVATLKLYTRVNLADLGGFKTPEFNGFWSEVLRQAQNLDFQRENINGTIYNTAVLQQNVLIPERSGQLTIEQAELTAVAQVQVSGGRSRSLFDQYFGRRKNVKKVLTSPPININVKPLPPGAPGTFTGAVGDIKLNATLDPLSTKTNEPISLKLTFSGSGNLKLLPEPQINFPTDFEVYDPKVSNNYNASAKGFSGRKTFEYLLIPRHEGTYEIPKMEFAVFDLQTKKYKTLSAGPFTVEVAKGEGGTDVIAIDPGMIKEDVEQLGSDIRYIKTNEIELRSKDRPFFGSASFYLSYAASLGAFFLVFFLLKRQQKQREDVVFMKTKKAGRVAQKRLKAAKEHMDKGEREPFYKEVLNAQWGYLSDKLNIPRGQLNKERVSAYLAEKGVEQSLIEDFLGLMDRCEFAQFAPGVGEGELSDVYNEAAGLIGKMEGQLKIKH